MRRLALLLTVLLTPPALASQVSESNCFQYLVSDWSDFTVTSVHIENASHWLRANTGKDFDPDELVRLPDFKRMIQEHREALPDGHIKTLLAKFIYTRWHVWNTANQQSRDAALTLELKKLKPVVPTESNVVSFINDTELFRLSRTNLQRLLTQVEQKYEIQRPSQETLGLVDQMVGELKFHYWGLTLGADEQRQPPLASPFERTKLRLIGPDSFYSQLVQGARSVGFNLVASGKKQGFKSINGSVPRVSAKLSEEFARDNGFMMPDLRTATGMLSFFKNWEPSALHQLYLHNRYYLPAQIKSAEDMLTQLDPAKMAQYFPEEQLFERMAPLRQLMHKYVLTTEDGESFLRKAFYRFLLHWAENDPAGFSELQRQYHSVPGAPQVIFAKKFLDSFGWTHVTLRIPVSVPFDQYELWDSENMVYVRHPDYTRKPQSPADSRRLDPNL